MIRFSSTLFFFSFAAVLSAQTVSTIAGRMDVGGWQDGEPMSALFNNPHGLARDAQGNLYVADRYNHVIRQISNTGEVTTFAGQAGNAGATDGLAQVATFNEPWGLNVANDGSVLVADTRNNLIRRISPTGVVTTIAGTGSYGFNDGPALQATFGNPTDLIEAQDGTIYIVDHLTHVIRKLSPNGQVTTIAGRGDVSGYADGQGSGALFFRPYGLDMDSAGDLIIADEWNHRIRRLTPAGLVTTIAGTGEIGWRDGTTEEAQFNYPWDVAVDAADNIWVGDGYNYVIRQISPASWVSTIAGVTQEPGEVDGPALDATFDGPTSLVLNESTTTLWIADAYNHTVRKISPLEVEALAISLSGPDNLFCEGEAISISINGELGEVSRLYLNDQIIVLDTVVPTFFDLAPGDYTVQLQTERANGQQAVSAPLSFSVVSSPTVSIASPDGTVLAPNGALRLQAVGNAAWQWSTGETESEIIVDTVGEYELAGTIQGCPAVSASITITREAEPEPEPEPEIDLTPWLPTAFSPNGDGANDILRVRGLQTDTAIDFRIYDRWGREVFYSSEANLGWDGQLMGRPVLPDTYTYLLCFDDVDGNSQRLQGQIQLHY